MSERFDTLISCLGSFQDQQLSEKLFLYPTNSRNKLARFFDALKLGSKLMREHKLDAVFCQDPIVNGLTGLLLAKKYKARLMVSVFGISVFDRYWQKEHWYNPLLKHVGKIVMKNADVIQADGLGNFEALKEKYGKKVFWKPIVPSDIDDYVAQRKEFLPDSVRLLFVGRLAKQKNIEMLAKVVGTVARRRYPCRTEFTIIGDGPERKRLAGLEGLDNVKLIKNCNRQELNEQYKNNDVLLLTSFYEGFPRVFMEAAANGLVFVVTAVSGAKNIIDEGCNGFIVGHDDVDGFISRVEELVSNRELLESFSKHTLENFSKKYHYGLSISQHKEIISYLEKI